MHFQDENLEYLNIAGRKPDLHVYPITLTILAFIVIIGGSIGLIIRFNGLGIMGQLSRLCGLSRCGKNECFNRCTLGIIIMVSAKVINHVNTII